MPQGFLPYCRLHRVAAGGLRPTPQLGTLLGKYKLNIAKFCTAVNEASGKVAANVPVEVGFDVQRRNGLELWVDSPRIPWYIKQVCRITPAQYREIFHSRYRRPTRRKHWITRREIYAIALAKRGDLEFLGRPLREICADVANACNVMRIGIVDELPPAALAQRKVHPRVATGADEPPAPTRFRPRGGGETVKPWKRWLTKK